MAQTPATEEKYTGDGVTTVYQFEFPYQKESDVFVSVNDMNVPFTLLPGSIAQVQLVTAPPLGADVRVYRNTPAYTPLHLFDSGVPFLPRYVDENNRQLLYAFQEGIGEFNGVLDEVNDLVNRSVRAPSTDTPIPPMPNAAARAGKVLAFDGVGNPIATIPTSGEIGDFATDLANNTNPGLGAAMVGYNGTTVKEFNDDMGVTPKQFGLIPSSPSTHQPAINAMLASSAKVLRFPHMLYRAGFENNTSGRTFKFDEGAIFDGTVHLAIGKGPDVAPVQPTVDYVENIRVIGTCTSTVRVGTIYARKLNIDKLRITEVSPSYTGQTAAGGSSGVHLYCGTQDCEIGEIQLDSATAGLYGLGIDINTINNAEHRPSRIHINKYTVKNNTQAALVTAATEDVRIDNVYVEGHNGIGTGVSLSSDTRLSFGKFVMRGLGSAASKDGIYLLTTGGATFDEVDLSGITQIGFRVGAGATGPVVVNKITATASSLDNIRLDSPATIKHAILSNPTNGSNINIQAGGAGSQIGRVESVGGPVGGVVVSADNVSIDDVKTTNPSGFGMVLNAGATNFRNKFVEAYGSTQGVRCLSAGPVNMGIMYLHDNTNGFVGTGMSDFSYELVRYVNNGTDTNTVFELLPAFRGRLYPLQRGVQVRGDVDVSATARNAYHTQRWNSPLTTNRTLTLSTTGGLTGDCFRVVRTAAATGAFNLSVGGLKNLAAGQWCDVEFDGTAWVLTAFGSL